MKNIMGENNKALIQLFAKAPVVGSVKTRLGSVIGFDKSAALAKLLLEVLIRRFNENNNVECWVSGDLLHPALSICDDYQVPRYTQIGDDLGERMLSAVRQGLQKKDKVIIVGSDCLGVTMSIIKQAEQALHSHDAVFCPAEDGGFVLWGVSKAFLNSSFYFSDVSWGESSVWHDVQSVLAQYEIDYAVLDECWDLDTFEDVKKNYASLPREIHCFLEENSIIV